MANTQGIRAGRAFVEIGGDDARLQRALKRAQQRLKAFGAGVRQVGLRAVAASAAILAPLAGATKIFASSGDQLDKMAARTGLSAEALSQLGFAAEQSGADIETLEKGIRTMQRTINDAQRGLSTATDAFDDLGLNFKHLASLSPEEQFQTIADAIARVEDPSKRAALAMQVLGRAGTQLLPLLANMRALRAQADSLGLTISTKDASSAALLTDTLNILWRTVRVGAFVIGSALAPTIIDLSNRIIRIIIAANEWIKANRDTVVWVAKVGVAVGAVGGILIATGLAFTVLGVAVGGLGSALGVAVAVIAQVGVVLGAILSPIGLLITAAALLGGTVVAWSGAGGKALQWLRDRFGKLSEFVGTVIGGIRDALAGGDVALAARVLWAGLRVAWEQGIQPLRQAWIGFSAGFQRAAIIAFSGVRKAWIEVRDWFERNFPDFTAGIAKGWANLAAGVQRIWARVTNWLADRFTEVMGLLDESLDVNAAKALNQQQLNADLNQVESQRKDAIAEAERRRNRTDAEREQEKTAALNAVDSQRNEALSQIDEQTAERVRQAEEVLARTKQELADAVEAARQRREQALTNGEDPASLALQRLADVGDQLDALASKVSVRGTFDASAVRGLAAGDDSAERTARATEQTARHTKRLVEASSKGLAFG